jgi:hypothetical protein
MDTQPFGWRLRPIRSDGRTRLASLRARRAGRADEGTVVFVDLSGFTRVSERLAPGRDGAENLVSVRVASHAAKHSKSRVNSEPARDRDALRSRLALGQSSRRRRQWIMPPGSEIQVASDRVHGRVSLRALVEYSHSGQSRRRARFRVLQDALDPRGIHKPASLKEQS